MTALISRADRTAAPILAFGFAALLCSATAASADSTVLFLDSQPGDFLGGGQTHTFTPSDGTFTATVRSSGIEVQFTGTAGPTFHSWNLLFGPTEGGGLAPGAFDDARRWGFGETPIHPGLAISGDGVGCSSVTGRFVVYELLVNASGSVLRFAADFEQHCSGPAAMFGSIRFNSDVPIEPRIAVAGRLLLEGD
jgi:hypothetical protein